MNINEAFAVKVLNWGGNFFGVADLEVYRLEIGQAYGERFTSYPRAISFGVAMPHPPIDELLTAPSHTYLAYYDIANGLINEIGLRLSNDLVAEGYRAFPIPASQRLGETRGEGLFSHRLAAALAGLGWIGKSCSLIHPKVGPRLRLGTVLTDAPLLPDTPMENHCGSCTLCTEICPANALLGKDFEIGQNIGERFDFRRCDAYLSEVRQTFGKRICGKCIAVCPHGRKGRKEKK